MVTHKKTGPAKATSPASSGPAGSEFEAQVGASYLLSMIVGGEPFGLPGTVIDSIEFQRAGEGHPLDDVIVHSHDFQGNTAVLEVQVKRSISFSPSDEVFKSVVAQMVEAARKSGFWDSKHQLAVATARTSRKIDGAYQDVLSWARHIGSAATFTSRIERKGTTNDDMRTFVSTFRSHLREECFPDDDEMVWKLLRRFQILIFDYTATGSASEALARERCAHALDPSDASRYGDLWGALQNTALSFAARGGDLTKDSLRAHDALKTFRWAGEQRHQRALEALAENASAALDDIRNEINGVNISRPKRVAEVRERLEQSRYVEIRGDAGVGKSGILKHFALQGAEASGIIVLKSGRIIPRGWTAFRSAINFDGSAKELLAELSINGMGLLFIDNLDLFTLEEQTTVNDLLRTAADIPSVSVIATARRNFGDDDVWLAQDALRQLGVAQPVMISELDDTEVEELADADPSIASLLLPEHPARYVTRNLYRLSRLSMRPDDAPILRTESSMADEWWNTADGPKEGRRDRQRALKRLAEDALTAKAIFDVSSQPPEPVDSLIASETLTDYGNDHVGFRHDILREWAVAQLIGISEDVLYRLPLDKPAPAFLARSVELHARSLIEKGQGNQAWSALFEKLARPGIHGSWRRAVLLALVRSEAAPIVLQRVKPRLFTDDGALLNELIRTTMAVEVQQAREIFDKLELDASMLPDSFTMPSSPSWSRLIVWLLRIESELPDKCIPDVVGLFSKWSISFFGRDPITPQLLTRFYNWLTQIEAAEEEGYLRRSAPYFGNALTHDQLSSLEIQLRYCFAALATLTPELAAEYLRVSKHRKGREKIANAIHEFRGTLAAAAPNELADFYEASLVPAPQSDSRPRYRRNLYIDDVFTHFDSQFLPVSPAQGPFFDLLKVQPETGKQLIRRLIDYAISKTCNSESELDTIEVATTEGVRRFQSLFTFMWSRENSSMYYAVSSGLMALEAWGHERIEAGEAVDAVVSDVIGSGDAPAAYLLVAVDLVLSHWPASRDAAIPFVGNPKLLIKDRMRCNNDSIEFPDVFGLKGLQREPMGPVNSKSLSERPSRKSSLYDLLKYYTFDAALPQRDRLIGLLQTAAQSLSSPSQEADLGDPEFMVLHALNLLDRSNWRPMDLPLNNGDARQDRQYVYVAPQSEVEQLAPFQDEVKELLLGHQVQSAASTILENPSYGSVQIATKLAEWAMAKPMPDFTEEHEGGRESSAWSISEAITNVAMIVMRDGDSDLRQKVREWAHTIFDQQLSRSSDYGGGRSNQLRFNPQAIAFAGLAFSLRDHSEEKDIRKLLRIAAAHSRAVVRGVTVSASAISQVDERLLKSIFRCALRATVFCRQDWQLEEGFHDACKAKLQEDIDVAIDREIDWIIREGVEPDWPDFPLCNPVPRRRLRIGVATSKPEAIQQKTEKAVDSHCAADWLGALRDVFNISQHPWLRDIVEHYRGWTSNANGSLLEEEDDIDRPPSEWNHAYFGLMADCLPGLSTEEVDKFALSFLSSFRSPSVFLNVSAHFIRSADVIYLDTDNIDLVVATHVRQRLVEELQKRQAWSRFARNKTDSFERNIGDMVSAILFHIYNSGFAPAKCYLSSTEIDKSLPLLPTLEGLAVAPSLLIAVQTMNLLEIAPKIEQLPFAIAVVKAWASERQDDPVFWVRHSIGRRFCQWLEQLREMKLVNFQSGAPERADLDEILAALVRSGVSEARSLEAKLSDL